MVIRYGTESVEMHYRVFGGAHLETGIALRTLGQIYDEMGDSSRSIEHFREAIDAFRRGGYDVICTLRLRNGNLTASVALDFQ